MNLGARAGQKGMTRDFTAPIVHLEFHTGDLPRACAFYAGLCGWTLARAHARSGDAAAIASYLGTGDKFDHAMAGFAETYADQNEEDYAALKLAVDSGKLAAESA